MNFDEEFFESEVEFISAGEGLVEAEHPFLSGRSWSLPSLVGLIGGALLMVASPAYATDPRVTPLEAAAIERHHQNDAERIAAQDLNGIQAHAQELLAKLRRSDPTGGSDLRSETARRFGPDSAAHKFSGEQSFDAAARFVVSAK